MSFAASGTPRGYLTTPLELTLVAQKALAGIEPYKSAALQIRNYANTGSNSIAPSSANPKYWPYPTGPYHTIAHCANADDPTWLSNGSKLVWAKVLVYRLSGDTRYADDAITHILDATTSVNWGGEVYDGSNECMLSLSHYAPNYVLAADLLEGYTAWTAVSKTTLLHWLATEVFKKVHASSQTQINNWGSAGSSAAAVIADYNIGDPVLLKDAHGISIAAHKAFFAARRNMLDRMNGNNYMTRGKNACPAADASQGIRADGGIPWELVRWDDKPISCDHLWFQSATGKDNGYQNLHLQCLILGAELLLRRGDSSIYDNTGSGEVGSMKKAILFGLHNPNDVRKSYHVHSRYNRSYLEFAYRYYGDPYMAAELGIPSNSTDDRRSGVARYKTRNYSGDSGRMTYFGTLLAGFAVGENPVRPPTTTPP